MSDDLRTCMVTGVSEGRLVRRRIPPCFSIEAITAAMGVPVASIVINLQPVQRCQPRFATQSAPSRMRLRRSRLFMTAPKLRPDQYARHADGTKRPPNAVRRRAGVTKKGARKVTRRGFPR